MIPLNEPDPEFEKEIEKIQEELDSTICGEAEIRHPASNPETGFRILQIKTGYSGLAPEESKVLRNHGYFMGDTGPRGTLRFKKEG